MEDKYIAQRTGRIFEFFKSKKDWIQYVVLSLILWLAYSIRSSNWDLLKDVTNGKYISLEVDSTLFLRYAQYIAEHGRLFAVDFLRSYPAGLQIDFGVYTSYFVAYLYKLLHIFNSSITVEYVNVVYPTIATIIASVFLFLFVRRIFDYRVALLSVLLLVTAPIFLFRSMSSDHDILGLMFVFMTLYFFVVGWQAKKLRNSLLFGALAAFTTILGLNTAGNIKVFAMVVALFTLVHIALDNIKKSDLHVYPIWYVLTYGYLLLSGKLGISSILSDFTSGLPTTFAFFSLLVYWISDKHFVKDSKIYKSLSARVPKGFLVLSFVGGLGFLFITLFFGFGLISGVVNGLLNIFSEALVFNRWASTVAENRRIFIVDWFSSFGRVIFWSFIIGLILLLYRLVNKLHDGKKLFYVYSISILSFIFSKYSENSALNGKSTLSNFMFFGSVALILFYTIYYYFTNYYSASKLNNKFSIDIDWRYTLIIIIALVNVVGGTTAVRLFFELAPFVVILSSFALVSLLDYFISLKSQTLKYFGFIFLILLLFSPLISAKGIILDNINSSYNQARASGPSYNQQWQVAGKWVRENLPKNAVFIHWWDYGYWVQAGFERATVTDGGNRVWWWNYLTARSLLTAPNDEDPLKFLYSHNVTHMLIVSEEIGKYPAYSLIGSDKDFDRYSFLQFFTLDNSLTTNTKNGTLLVYRGVYPLDEDLILNDSRYPKGSAVVAVLVPVENKFDDNGTVVSSEVKQPYIVLQTQQGSTQLSMKCIYADKLYSFEKYDYGGCVRIAPTVQNNQVNNIDSALFMSRRVADSLFAKLYVLGQDSDYFKLVYSDETSTPLAVYSGGVIGPTKIWEVKYPENFTVNRTEYEYYNLLGFGDPTLMDF